MADSVGTAVLELRADPSKLFSDLGSLAGRLNGILGSAFKNITDNVASFSKGLDGLVGGFNKLGGEGSALSGALEGVVGGIKNALGGFTALGPVGAGVAVVFAGITAGIGLMVAGLGAAGLSLYSMMRAAADAGDALLTLHNQTGLSVQALSELKFVGEQADVPLETMTGAIFKLGATLSEGGEKAQRGLKMIGVSFADIRKLSPDKAFELVIQKLHDIPDAGQRAAAGMMLFGKNFKDISQLTQEDMQGLIGKAHDMGAVMSTEFAVAGDRFNDALGVIATQVDALKFKIGSAFLPVAIAFVEVVGDEFQKALSAGSKAFDGTGISVTTLGIQIAQVAVLTVSALADIGTGIASWVSSVALGVGAVISAFGSLVGAMAKVVQVQETLTLSGHDQSDWIAKVGAGIKGFGQATEDGAHRGLVAIQAFSDGQHNAAQRMALEIPLAVGRVSQGIRETSAAIDDAAKKNKTFGDGLAEVDKQTQELKANLARTAKEIDDARSRMSESDVIKLFGKDVLKLIEDAQKAGVEVPASFKAIGQAETDNLNAAYFQKIAIQSHEGVEKILKDADVRQQKEGEGLVALATANANYYGEVARLSMTGTDREIADINRKRDAELLALPVETAANKAQLDIRRQQIDAFYTHQIDVARGTYSTIVERMQAAGVATRVDLQKSAVEADRDYKQMAASGAFSADTVRAAWEDSLHKQAAALGGFKGDLLNVYSGLADQIAKPLADMLAHWHRWRDDLKSLWGSLQEDFAQVLENMFKRWVEGFLMKMLDSLTGSRGAFASAFSGLLSGAGGGSGGGPGLGMVRQFGGLLGGLGGGAAVGGGVLEGGIPIFGAGSGLGTNVTAGAMGSDPALAGASPGAAGGTSTLGILGGGLMAAQGLYTMWKAQTRGQNVLGGMETGAGIGTMILPGIGTAIGAGFGALAGLFKSFFGVSQKEKEGRSVVSDFQQQTFGGLNDAQRKEAAGAGWTDPQAAGTLIAVRDAYLAIGKTSQDAERDVKALWDAEKQGPEATTAAMQPLLAALDAQKKKQTDVTAAVEAAKAKYAELADGIKAKMVDLNKSIADLDASEKPEEVMGNIEKAQRAAFAKQKQELEAALEANNRAAAEAVEKAKKDATSVTDGLGNQVAQLPEQFADSGRESWDRFSHEFDGKEIHIPVVPDLPVGTPMPPFPSAPPIPGHASGGLFGTPHLARIAEGGRAEFIGDSDFMGDVVGRALSNAGGYRGPTDINVTVEIKGIHVDGADVRRALVSPEAKQAVADAYHEALVIGGAQRGAAKRVVKRLVAEA